MVARFFAAAMLLVDAAADQAVRDRGTHEQMIDAKAMVALPCPGLKVPEGPYAALRIMRRQRIGPALAQERTIGRDALRLDLRAHQGGDR